MRERVRRELQLEAPRRIAQRRILLLFGVGQDHHRELAPSLQHHPATLIAPLHTARPGSCGVAGYATPTSSAGHPSRRAQANNALTFNPDPQWGPASWTLARLWDVMLDALAESDPASSTVQMIDSTIVRAHHHAAGQKGGLVATLWAGRAVGSRPKSPSGRTRTGSPSTSS